MIALSLKSGRITLEYSDYHVEKLGFCSNNKPVIKCE